MQKNKMSKARPKGNPYLTFTGPFGPVQVLKSWQTNNAKPFGRWFVYCNGDLGDSYVYEVANYGELLAYDETVFTADEAAAVVAEARTAPKPVW